MQPDLWKATAVFCAMLALLSGTEWFVTYCVFSDMCPLVEEMGDMPVIAVP